MREDEPQGNVFVPASVADVEACLLRALTVTEKQYVPVLLAQAERKIRALYPDRMAEEPLCGWDTVKDVQAEIVARRLRNPEGFLAENDGQYSYQRDRVTASGRLEVTETDKAALGVAEQCFTVVNPVLERERRGRL